MKNFTILFIFFILFSHATFSQDAQELIKKANNLSKNGAQLQAIDLLQNGLKEDPNNADFAFNIAQFHEQLKNSEEAIAFYEQTIRIKDSHILARNKLAALYVRNKEFAEAVKNLNFVFEKSDAKEDKMKAKFRIIQIYEENNLDTKEFEQHLNDLKSMGVTTHPRILASEAKLFYQNGQYLKAKELSDQALKIVEKSNDKKTDFESLYFVNVMSNVQTANYADASRYVDSIQSEPFLKIYNQIGHEYYFKLGYAYFFSYELAESLNFLNIALKIKPDYNAARIFLNQVENKNAPKLWAIESAKLKLVEKMAEKNAKVDEADHYNNLARLYLHEKKYQLAARSADSCLTIIPSNLEAWYLKGICEYKQNNNDEAIDDLENLIEKAIAQKVNRVNLTRYYFMLGLAYKRIESKKTVETFQKAKFDIYEGAAEWELKNLQTSQRKQ